MSISRRSLGVVGVALFALIAIAFFFDIIGVFGLTPAIVGLLIFVSVVLMIVRLCPADGEGDGH